jgi:protein kinase X
MGISESKKVNIFNPLDFEVHNTIGKGHFSRVRLVKNKKSGEYSVWKIFCKDEAINYKNNIFNEIKIHASLENQFISKFKGFAQTKGHLYFNIELCAGGDLFSLLRRKGRFSLEEAVFYSSQILVALKYLRSKGIIYRDLKPENIMICQDGYIKLSDFGCSKIIKDRTFTVCGTLRYCSPEILQINNQSDKNIGYTFSTDYWSLGVLIYEMIAGIDPFASSNDEMIKEKILCFKYFYNSLFNEDLKDLIDKLFLDQNKRIGHQNIDEIFKHKFFDKIDFKSLVNKDFKDFYKPTHLHYKTIDEKERIPKSFEENEDPFLSWFDELS